MQRRTGLPQLMLGWGLLLLATGGVRAQVELPPDGSLPLELQQSLGGPSGLGLPGAALAGPRVEFSGWFQVQEGGRTGWLSIKATVQPQWHIYSTTQAEGGPNRTVIKVTPSPDFQLSGDFQADRDPAVHTDPVFPGVQLEEFSDEVTWTVALKLAQGVDPQGLRIQCEVNGQVCTTGGACDLVNGEPVQAQFAGYVKVQSAATSVKGPQDHVTIVGYLEPRIVAPGETARLVLTANLQSSWHVYHYAPTDPEKISKPTLIVLSKVASWAYDEPQASVEAKTHESGLEQEPVLYYHEGTVSWTIPIHVPRSAQVGEYPIRGAIAFQTCTHNACDLPSAASFQVTAAVSKQAVKGRVPLEFSDSEYDDVARQARQIAEQRESRAAAAPAAAPTGEREAWLDTLPLSGVMAIAFLAGLILNVMPCVLPVIGLKVMSFVHQAGGSRGEILSLNLWFSLGLLSVFWILGAAAAFAGHAWGEHFGDMRFLVVMIGIVFAFGLSFLGVWEIPIPGFVGSGAAQGAAEREGAVGAFSKGVLSTILATPCAGPLIGPAVGWAVKQPAGLTMSAFTAMGLGMAAPYLMVGLFPQLVNQLPKPGAWMDTFKQLMGFLLMATVVFLFMSVPPVYVIPTLTLLLGISIACWWIGRTPLTAPLSGRLRAWSVSVGLIVVSALFGFVTLGPSQAGHGIDWQPFTRVALDEHLTEGKTVMVDFTANW